MAGPAEIMRRYGAIAVALLAVQIDFFAIALALPDMAEDLDTSTTDLQWSVSAYMIAIGIAMVPAGRVAELIGRKRVWLIGFAIFGLASLAVGLSQTPEQVVAFRIIQGLGAGLYSRSPSPSSPTPRTLSNAPESLASCPASRASELPWVRFWEAACRPRSDGAGYSSSMYRWLRSP